MQESHRKGVATILTPSHARAVVRLHLKRWTGAYAGWVLSSEKAKIGEPTVSGEPEGNRAVRAIASVPCPAESQTPSTHRNSMRENREAPWPSAVERRRTGWRTR